MMNYEGQIVTYRWLAGQAGVTREYIAQLCRRGVLECSKPVGRDWLIDWESAEEWLRSPKRRRQKD